MSTLYIYSFTRLYMYCMPRGVKGPDIVKVLMFALYKLSAFDLVPQYSGLFSGYIMYILRCDCHTAINLKNPNF